jgi:hypothetical protein
MVKLRAWLIAGKMVFIALTYGLPGATIAEVIASDKDPPWLAIAVSIVCVVLAIAYTGANRRLSICRQALVRVKAKQDAGIKYIIYPPGDDNNVA